MALGMCIATTPVSAQQTEYTTIRGKVLDYNPHRYQFVGLQGGVENTFANFFDTKRLPSKTWMPTMSVSYGGFWSRILGARLHFNGLWNKTGIACSGENPTAFHKYNYITPNADLLINLCNANNNHDVYPVNAILVAGLGSQIGWETSGRAEACAALPNTRFMYSANDIRAALNARLGLIFDIPVSKHWSVNLETDLNYVETFTNKVFNSDNLQFVAQLGVNYKFGMGGEKKPKVKKEKPAPVVVEPIAEPVVEAIAEPVVEAKPDSIPYDEVNYRTITESRSAKWEVFYPIRESEFDDTDAKLAKIGAFLQKNHSCKINIKSYADAQTGNSTINMKYSKQRAEKAYNALINAGVNKDQITMEYLGDTVQPFGDNDLNRCTIISVTGLEDVKQEYTVRKFKPAK